MNGQLEGVPQQSLGDLRSPMVINHWNKAWDDPPSTAWESTNQVLENIDDQLGRPTYDY